jgi:hypothetical protein
MLRSCDRCCARFVRCCALAVVAAICPIAVADEKPKPADKTLAEEAFAEQSFAAGNLVTSTAVANELTELCTALIEPASWEQASGSGKIKVGRKAIAVTNSAAAREQVRLLVAALAKLPTVDEKSAAESPKTRRFDIHTTAAAANQDAPKSPQQRTLAVYPVADLVWIGDKSPPDFDSLVMLVETCVAPHTWATNNGDGEIKPFASRGALVIRNAPDTLAAVDTLLAAIRKLPKLSAGKPTEQVATAVLAQKLGAKGDAEARLYHVADIALGEGKAANFNPIMQRLMDNATAETWQRNGGDGSLRKIVDRGGLVIVNTAAAHGAVEAELAKMRAEQAAEQREKEKSEKGPRRGKGNRE